MAANKEEQKLQKASKYYPAEDVAVPKKVCSPMRSRTVHQQEEDHDGEAYVSTSDCSGNALGNTVEGSAWQR